MTETTWKKHFFGWHEAEENCDNTYSPDFHNTLTKEELQLQESYALSLGQLYWRRQKISSMRRPELFPQEYPINDIECFLFSGRNRFDISRLQLYLQNVQEPRKKGYLRRDLNGNIQFTPDNKGAIWIYKEPVEQSVYIIGADVARGIGGNNCSATIFDTGRNIVATYVQDVEPNQFGRDLCVIGKYYNTAVLAVECNNHGLATLTTIRDEIKYPRNRTHYHTTMDKATNKQTELIGFQTNEDTRETIISKLDDDLRRGNISIPCKRVISEMLAFIINKNGKSEAQNGAQDDMVIATAIGNWCINLYRNLTIEFDAANMQFQFKSKRR